MKKLVRRFAIARRFALAILSGGMALAVGGGIPSANAAEYDIDLAHSFIQFRIEHLGFSWLIGRFNNFAGEFTYDPPAGPQAQKILVEIDADSIDSNHAERDKHLRSPDFLDVQKYPTAMFVSTRFEGGDNNQGVMHGDLTLHGVTKPVAIAVKKIGEGDDPWGGHRAGFEGTVTLYRSDYGMDTPVGPNSNKMELMLYIEGIRR